MDLDADSKINKDEFLEAIRPQEPFSKMLVRQRIAKRGPREALVKSNEKIKKKV